MGGILIADAGSSKTDWSFINKKTGQVYRYQSSGINPVLHNDALISRNIENIKNEIGREIEISEIHFFGSGCASDSLNDKIKKVLAQQWPSAQIDIESDIVGACKALFQDSSGIACILGTGSNTCLYSDGKIESQIPSLGFILGDEGSGAALGKRLLNSFFKRQFPEKIHDSFIKEYNLTVKDVIDKVYKGPSPSAFLASFSPFIYKNRQIPEIKNLIFTEFDTFFERNILPYKKKDTLGFVGSIAWHFQDEIKKCAERHHLIIASILQYPMPSLEKYYLGTEI